MNLSQFRELFQEYLVTIEEAKQKKAHHDQLRNIFVGFLDKAFGVKCAEVELEKGIQFSEVRGFIDALYKDIIFEFKRDLATERDKGLQELSTYIQSLQGSQLFAVT